MIEKPRAKPSADDAPGFLALVDRAIRAAPSEKPVPEVHVVRVRNWFGRKWLGYSGMEAVAFPQGYALDVHTALSESHQSNVTFPPFSPHESCRRTTTAGPRRSATKNSPRLALSMDRRESEAARTCIGES